MIMSEESERVKYLLKYWSHLQLAREYEQLENIIKEVREYIEKHKVMTQGHFDGKQWVYQYYELTCDPKELLEILDKENK